MHIKNTSQKEGFVVQLAYWHYHVFVVQLAYWHYHVFVHVPGWELKFWHISHGLFFVFSGFRWLFVLLMLELLTIAF